MYLFRKFVSAACFPVHYPVVLLRFATELQIPHFQTLDRIWATAVGSPSLTA
jgi:hypothetical protein